jgi:hypothetical protein
MNRTGVLFVLFALGSSLAGATPYWVAWDDGWPDAQGWTRGSSNPPAQQWLADGLLFIDSRTAGGYDGYYQEPANMSPGPGEAFLFEWRLRIDEITAGLHDPGVIVTAPDYYAVAFYMRMGLIESVFESGRSAAFAAGEFHSFSLHSSDMRAYELYIDGVLALQGPFFAGSLPGPRVSWGDQSSGKSLVAWDYVHYGVTPEPSTFAHVWALVCLSASLRRSAAQRIAFRKKGERQGK